MPSSFRFQAKYGLVTYAQCDALDPWRVLAHFSELGAECIIGRENHATEGTHLHVFFMFENKRRLSGERVFDVDGYHPNIKPGYSNPRKGYDYATKDGDIVCGGLGRPADSDDESHKARSHWFTIVASETADDFWRSVAELDPRALCINFTSLRAYCEHRYRVDRSEYRHPPEIRFELAEYPDLDQWVASELRVNGKDRYVVVTPLKGVPLEYILC